MGVLSYGYKGLKAGGKKLFDLAAKKGEKSNVVSTIVGVDPKVNKTKKDKLTSKLNILKQQTKASGAKLDQTRFEIKNKMPLTFGKSSKKTMSNTEKAKLRNDKSKEAFKASESKTKVFYPPENFNKGGRVGLKSGTQLSAKQMKIASLAGNKKKIDGPDFKKLRAMKSPMDKTVRKS